jgi:hypothetical protein
MNRILRKFVSFNAPHKRVDSLLNQAESCVAEALKIIETNSETILMGEGYSRMMLEVRLEHLRNLVSQAAADDNARIKLRYPNSNCQQQQQS